MSPSSSSLQSLLAQFQNRYPTGSLTAELLTVHGDQYVVRALIQVGGSPLATGMAAAKDIEQAEDRAKIRALEGLAPQLPPPSFSPLAVQPSGLPTTQPIGTEPSTALLHNQSQTQPQSLSDRLAAVGLSLDTSGGTAKLTQAAESDMTMLLASSPSNPLLEPLTPSTSPLSSPLPSTQDPVVADWYSHINVGDEESADLNLPNISRDHSPVSTTTSSTTESSKAKPVATPTTTPSQTPQDGKPRLKNEQQPNPDPPAGEFVDLSDVIAQTDVELARLGWNRTQGREHLKRAYGKRSRQELDETELYDFLHHLESQPSPQ